jgi:HPt (histidine-containing phosphotransfer) domain-containing protein
VGIDRVLVKPVSLPSLASALGLGTGDPALLFRSAPGVLPATNIEALYRVTCRRDLAALSLAVRAQDWRLASQLAHRIRGASQILGANAIAGIASVLERMDGDRAANADLHALALRWLSRLLDPGQDSASRPP